MGSQDAIYYDPYDVEIAADPYGVFRRPLCANVPWDHLSLEITEGGGDHGTWAARAMVGRPQIRRCRSARSGVGSLRARDEGGPPLAGQLLYYPRTDLAREYESDRTFADGYGASREGSNAFRDAYAGHVEDKRDP